MLFFGLGRLDWDKMKESTDRGLGGMKADVQNRLELRMRDIKSTVNQYLPRTFLDDFA